MSCQNLVEKDLNTLNYKTNTAVNKYISQETFNLLKEGKTLFPPNKQIEATKFDGANRSWHLDICKINTELPILTPDFFTKVKAINRESKAAALREPIESLLISLEKDYTNLLLRATNASGYEKPSLMSTIGSVFAKQKTYVDKVRDALFHTNKAYKNILMDKIKQINDALQAAMTSEAARLGISTMAAPAQSQLNKEISAAEARLRSMQRPGTLGAGSGTRGGKRKTLRKQKKRRQTRRRA